MPEGAALWLYEAVVRPDWVDYNGHMSEAYYVLVFGDATDALYHHVGMDDAFRRAQNVSVYTLEAHIRYLVEAHEGQLVRIATRVLWHDAKRLRLHHTMVDEGGQVLAVTEIAALHVDKAGPRACLFRPEPLARIAAVAAAQAGLGAPEPAMTKHWQARPGARPLDPAGDRSPGPNFAAQLSGGLGPSAPAGSRGPAPWGGAAPPPPPGVQGQRPWPWITLVDFALSHEQQLVVDTVRAFVETELYPLEPEVERSGVVPRDLGEKIRRKVLDLGFYAPNIPAEYGGGGLDHLTFTLLERELGRASMALGVWWGRPSNILCAANEEQKQRYLLPAVRGEKMDALAMTEPDAGSDVRGMKCSARHVGGDWVLNGTKHFISHADIADFVIVFVSTGAGRITAFLVDRGTPGFEIRSGYHSVSHRGYQNCILSFDDCRLPDAQMLGEEGGGFAIANTWLHATRLSVAALCVGRARRAFDLALSYAAQRSQFGRVIGKFQGVSFQLADMVTEIDAADYLTLGAAWRLDQGHGANREISQAKLYASEMLSRVADRALQIHGGMGLMADLPLERIWRDARVERIWDGTSEIQRHIISRELLRPLGA